MVSNKFYFFKCYDLNCTNYQIVSVFNSLMVNSAIQVATLAKIKLGSKVIIKNSKFYIIRRFGSYQWFILTKEYL